MVAIIIFVLAALCAPIAATKCSSSPQCPAENGCTVSTPNGAEIDLKCDTDFDGRVLKTIQASQKLRPRHSVLLTFQLGEVVLGVRQKML